MVRKIPPTPMICGGTFAYIGGKSDKCFKFQGLRKYLVHTIATLCFIIVAQPSFFKEWKELSEKLSRDLSHSGIGNVVINDKFLLVSGGLPVTNRQELVPLDGGIITSSLESPVDYGSCIIQLTQSSILITGGAGHTRNTWYQYFDDRARGKQEGGPTMLTGRMFHACGKLEINGDTVLIVAGGRTVGNVYLATSEYLNLNTNNLAWKEGKFL